MLLKVCLDVPFALLVVDYTDWETVVLFVQGVGGGSVWLERWRHLVCCV